MRLRLFAVAMLLGPVLTVAGPGEFLLTPAPAMAASSSCSAWHAAMEDDEGGPTMTASICAGAKADDPSLDLTCGDSVALRYSANTEGIESGSSITARFTVGNQTRDEVLQFQEMDATLGADLPKDDALLALLRSGSSLTITDRAGKMAPATFTLKGASAAIAKLLAYCASAAAASDEGD